MLKNIPQIATDFKLRRIFQNKTIVDIYTKNAILV